MARIVIFKNNGKIQSIMADGFPVGLDVAVVDYDECQLFHSPEEIAAFERQRLGQSSDELLAAGAKELYAADAAE